MQTEIVKEVAPDVFSVTLWCPEAVLLGHLLDPEAACVLVWGHEIGNFTWQPFQLPVVSPTQPMHVLSRHVAFDFVLPTAEFQVLLPHLGPKIQAVQFRREPPDFMDLGSMHGKQLFRLLREYGWHVLLETPANDYGEVMSPSRDLLERAIVLHRALGEGAAAAV